MTKLAKALTELAQAKLDAEIFEAMWDDMYANHNACIKKLTRVREALDWLWGFYDGNTLIAKPGFENDIRDAWIELLMSLD